VSCCCSNGSRSSFIPLQAATGVPNIAVMPAAARPQARSWRSAAVTLKHWANSDPIEPPVMMIGPSAPNGPPVPIDMADDSGFRIATFG